MATRGWWLAMGGLVGQACVADPLEGSGRAAADGTRVEVMLVPLDEGASIAEGAEAFDDALATTESLEDLARGDGAFVVGVDDGWGIALVPENLTDEAAAAANVLDEPTDDPDEPEPYEDGEPGSCALDCEVWCSTLLDLCSGDGASLCDCSVDDGPEDPAGEPEEEPEAACTWDCDEWCATTLDHCGGDGLSLCDCGSDDDYGAHEAPEEEVPEEEAACAWDCDEWCSSSLELCDGDGWDLCSEACDWNEAQPLPASAGAGAWGVPIVVGGVALLIVFTDPEVQAALERGESIGNAVGGTYGRRAQEIMRRLRELARETGEMADDAQRPCTELLTRQGYREQLDVAAGEPIRVGICTQDQLTVWPRAITVRAGDRTQTVVDFDNLGSGFRTVLSRDATVAWTQDGSERSAVVTEGQRTSVSLPIAVGRSLGLSVAVPRDGTSTGISLTVTR